MVGGGRRGGAPPDERLALQTAVVTAALGDGVAVGIPGSYAIDKLAQRWSVPPWELEAAPDPDWLIRGLEFQRIEAVKVTED